MSVGAPTMAMSPQCRKCGSIDKSGKSSCCARAGSWFQNCGSAGNAKLGHTWYEGIRVCRTRSQSKRVSSQQSNAVEQLNSLNAAGTGYSKAVAANTSVTCTATATVVMMSASDTSPLTTATTATATSTKAFVYTPAMASVSMSARKANMANIATMIVTTMMLTQTA